MLENNELIFKHFADKVDFFGCFYVNQVIHIKKYEHMLISMWIVWKTIH
jgi:hypothetical protein